MVQEMMNTLENAKNYSVTENGAVGYKTTGSELVDLNFRVPSMRNAGLSLKDKSDFVKSLNENLEYAVKWMFYVRDVRGGLGERSAFVSLFKLFYENKREHAVACLNLIAEYGRWKDLVDIAFCGENSLEVECLSIIKEQLTNDVKCLTEGKAISLLAKWMPSINAAQKSRNEAKKICKYLEIPFVTYRKMLAKLRNYLDVTEVKTCGNKWNEIDYNKVSSNANLKYSKAFMKHDQERRNEYLKDLANPEKKSSVKMNASVLFPHEIWREYNKNARRISYDLYQIDEIDQSYEAMWNNLKEIGDCGKTMCVVDGSGSMTATQNGVQPINIARSLGVYFAERCTGEFHNMMIEFSASPKIIDLNGNETLMDKINHMNRFDDCSNTNIEKTFMLILDTAVKNKMTQEDMPDRLLIVSDMEFDHVTYQYGRIDYQTLFDTINERFEMHGYKMPKLVFWNVASRTNTIPVKENDLGVILVSGYSVNIINMVMSNETDPWLALKSALDNERYNKISDTLNSIG